MTQVQSRYARQRLAVVRENKPRRYDTKAFNVPKTPAVAKAEKAIAAAQRITGAWNKKMEARRERIIKEINETHDRCTRLILTGDFKVALAAIDAFEAKKFV